MTSLGLIWKQHGDNVCVCIVFQHPTSNSCKPPSPYLVHEIIAGNFRCPQQCASAGADSFLSASHLSGSAAAASAITEPRAALSYITRNYDGRRLLGTHDALPRGCEHKSWLASGHSLSSKKCSMCTYKMSAFRSLRASPGVPTACNTLTSTGRRIHSDGCVQQ